MFTTRGGNNKLGKHKVLIVILDKGGLVAKTHGWDENWNFPMNITINTIAIYKLPLSFLKTDIFHIEPEKKVANWSLHIAQAA